MRYDEEKSLMYYDLWNGTGRLSIGEKTEMLVNNKQFFPGMEEVEIEFEVHDGFAVGPYQGREYLMIFPMMDDVKEHPRWVEEIECYVGERMIDETGLQVQDIAMTYGRIVSSRQLPLALDTFDTVIRLDAKAPLDDVLDLINTDIRQDILSSWQKKIPVVDWLPVKDDDTIMEGYLVLRGSGEAEYIAKPKNKKELEMLEKEALENGTVSSLKEMFEVREGKRLMQRFSDVQFIKGNNSIYKVSCKLDGIQMPEKELTSRESLKVHQNITRGMDPMASLGYTALLKKYTKELGVFQQTEGRITDVSVYPKNMHDNIGAGQWMIRCKVDGEQQMGRALLPALKKEMNLLTNSGQNSPEQNQWNLFKLRAARNTFQDVLYSHQQKQEQGIKR